MKKIINPNKKNWSSLIERPSLSYENIEPLAKKIFRDISNYGDSAVNKYSKKFDNIELNSFKVKRDEILKAIKNVPLDLKLAIQNAKKNIKIFHEAQITKPIKVETQPGVVCWQKKIPIERIGLYIPGGSAPLFSSILMLSIPAKVAKCGQIIMCSPPDANGNLADVILYTADLCGVDEIYKIGGIQAIAAMTFGTKSIPKVDKIFGPGNQYVTVAKQLAAQHKVAIDLPAGPSELMVVADKSANPDFIASDLLSQAEHGPDSQVYLITNDIEIADMTINKLNLQLNLLERKDIAIKALNNSKVIYFEDYSDLIDFTNLYGPEHLIVCLENINEFIDKIINAGSVFIGNFTPESAGDYASGTNHTLPTNGYSRQYSGVNLDSYLKAVTFQKISPEGLSKLGPMVEKMASAEGLEAHRNAISIRLKSLWS